jgi:hypothetical protein
MIPAPVIALFRNDQSVSPLIPAQAGIQPAQNESTSGNVRELDPGLRRDERLPVSKDRIESILP